MIPSRNHAPVKKKLYEGCPSLDTTMTSRSNMLNCMSAFSVQAVIVDIIHAYGSGGGGMLSV